MSDVSAGAVMTLVVPLALLVVVLALWGWSQRRALRRREAAGEPGRDG